MRSNPRAWGDPLGSAIIRSVPEDFVVEEQLGYEPSGEGEHVFLFLQKRELNTQELAKQLAELAGVPERDIGYSGMKDRNAVTRQWFSVGLAGRAEPDWQQLETAGNVHVLRSERHLRKLRRGVHRANRFSLLLREVSGSREALEQRLALLRDRGAPNYFGEQRFGRGGATLRAATRWASSGGRVSRSKRGLYLSAIRGFLYNELLGQRVLAQRWINLEPGEVCLLNGTNSFFVANDSDDSIATRLEAADLHPALPLWGRGKRTETRVERPAAHESGTIDGQYEAQQQLEYCAQALVEHAPLLAFLEHEGLKVAWRATRLLPHDFCWQFCDDDCLQLDFALGAGSYATALLAELVRLSTSEQGMRV